MNEWEGGAVVGEEEKEGGGGGGYCGCFWVMGRRDGGVRIGGDGGGLLVLLLCLRFRWIGLV